MTPMDRHERLRAAGSWLREQRERRFGTARQFAQALGVDPSIVSNYETGKVAPTDERAQQFAEALGMPIIEVRRGLGLWVPDEAEAARACELPDLGARLLAAINALTEIYAEYEQLRTGVPLPPAAEQGRSAG